MRTILVALVAIVSLLPGCCVIGMTVGGARAAAHNDEVARKLQRGEYVGPEDREEQSVDNAQATGFVVGALIDAAVATLAVSIASKNIGLGSPYPSQPAEYY